MPIIFKKNHLISPQQFHDLLVRSNLGERRPIDDKECLQGMLENSNLCFTAWDHNKLIGIARSVTDFHYCCYLSDIAVDQDYQHQGIGKNLIKETQRALKKRCKLILIAAPAANDYYKKIGFTQNDRCWLLNRDSDLN